MADMIHSLNLLETLKEFMEINKLAEVKEAVDDLLKCRLNLAVVGDRGLEKTTFIDSLLGLGPGDEGSSSASSPALEQSAMFTSPSHPEFRVFDLPPVPSMDNFEPEEYIERFKLLRFTAVILTFSQSLEPNVGSLWREAHTLQKGNLYFALLASRKDCKETLEDRRKSSIDVLKAAGMALPRVFLVCSSALEMLEFSQLQEQMEKDLPNIKATELLLALPPFSIPVIGRKKDAFKAVVWAAASLSGGVSTIRIPLLSYKLDIRLAMRILIKARDSLGLDEASLERLARQRGRDVAELKALRSCALSLEVTTEEVKRRLTAVEKEKTSCSRMVEMALPRTISQVSRSFVAMLLVLNTAIEEMAKDAEKVVTIALKD